MPKSSKTEFDIVLWGATGFTGRLVAEYLSKTQDTHGATWALAGRDRNRLEQVRSSLAALNASSANLPIVLADARNAASLDAMVARTRVVISTVGPYARYGDELVAACVRNGTDYCDLTGEVQWMRRTIDTHHEQARKSGARIVHTCGFDSIPSDLGVLVLQEYMKEHHGTHCHRVNFYVTRMRGGISGGTLASMVQAMDEMSADPSIRRVLGNPHALDPEPRRGNREERDQMGVRYSPELKKWTAPFFMAPVNTRVVRRSNALLGHPWGRDFLYSEASSFAPGVKGLLTAASLTAGMGAFMAAASVPPVRRLLEQRVLPGPGEGPSAETREKGLFEVRLLGEGTSPKDGRPIRLEGKVAAKGDPGYAATSRMLSQAALCLAFDEPAGEGGVLTPASSMGLKLVERLRKAGVTFDVTERS
ncbi:saccharopine dehydrogenase NADP-binding domain-containing protein [Stigmatella sp. ncwal1]|uniref:Saccharopine dehydrogenase NADP-binding domain-containing protein n=1 Tax=Stigmatella ashevillensis TaxID=2995309 RepID=A0ABT5DJL4_9BACT|nr:saccharopine dehydrogenase NADP-binding domain-containing protein [Stigmatella ashevillena]MDC0713847.1 saccharopine dehydrogenase NADP-binding domain-containing protein [Stigmatella ashevillena]